jgi:hypothetical protein
MDWLTFIAAVAKALAWPLTTLVLLVLLRRPLVRLIPLLRKLKWKELELEFEEKVSELKTEAAQALPAAASVRQLTDRTPSQLEHLAEASPRIAIIEAWIQVEHAAKRALSHCQPDPKHAWDLPPSRVGQFLRGYGLLDEDKLELYDSLRSLRNEAAHHEDFTISPRSAVDYVVLAQTLAAYLQSKA